MGTIDRYLAYAAAFEEAYASDDWSTLDPFFTEDAVYELSPPRRSAGSMRDAPRFSRSSKTPSTPSTAVSIRARSKCSKGRAKRTGAYGSAGRQPTPWPVRRTAAWKAKSAPCWSGTASAGSPIA